MCFVDAGLDMAFRVWSWVLVIMDGNESASHIFHKSASRMLVFLFSTGQAWIAPLVIVLGRSRGHHQWDARLERSVTRSDGFGINWMAGR